MKKITLCLFSFVFILCSVLAQMPENRSVTTVVADVLAQMPAQNQEKYEQAMRDLIAIGEEGIFALVKKLDDSNRAPAEYALSGIATYVSRSKDNVLVSNTMNAFEKAMQMAKNNETRAFLGSQLYLLGLTADSIGAAKNIDVVLPMEIKHAAAAAEKVSYISEKSGATDIYLRTLQASLEHDFSKENYKALSAAALKILKKAPENEYGTRIFALQIFTRAERNFSEEKIWKEILKAYKSENKAYRVAALENTVWLQRSAIKNNDKTLRDLLKKEKDPERKSEIIHALAEVAFGDIKNLKSISQRTNILMEIILPYLQNDNPTVRMTAMEAVGKFIDSQNIFPPNVIISGLRPINYTQKLIAAINTDNQQIVNKGKAILISLKTENLIDDILKALPATSDEAKIALIEILASRKVTAAYYVFKNNPYQSEKVLAAAYKALKDVTREKDLSDLYYLLRNVDNKYVPDIQQAIISVSSEKTLAELIKNGFLSKDKSMQDLAFVALLNWKSADATEQIFALCCNSAASNYFDKAFDTYVKRVSQTNISPENRLIFLRKAMEIAKTNVQRNEVLKQIGNVHTFLALLYAGDFLENMALKENAAQAIIQIALNNRNLTGENVVALLEKASVALTNPDADYQRQAIKKHIAEMPKEKGFVSIFNGKDLTGWKGLVENPITRAKMKPADLKKAQATADEQMRHDWVVDNGSLAFVGSGFNNLCSEKQYGDFEMYVDWLLDPSGKEADAGIYLRGTPQVQIWDIARTDVGAQVGSGGLYNNQTNHSKPLKVADNKLGEWNTMYIKMVGDRVTVRLNGEMVTDNVMLENYWDRNLPIFPVEQIELQAHGSKVCYRNLYIKELERPQPFELSPQEKKEGYKMLFDGTNMHEWTGDLVNYFIADGCINVEPKSNFGGNLYTKKEYVNFSFRFEFCLTPAANNGVGIRAPMAGDNAYNAMEIQILDCEHPVYKDIAPYQHHGSIYGIVAAEHGAMKPVGQWNEEEIFADGNHIKVTLNGKVIVDADLKEATKNGTADHNEHSGLFNKSGHIGFLGHGSLLKLRNIRIKEL